MKKEYITRLAENELKIKMNSSGCVLVTGPKFCGKSEMCKKYAKSEYLLIDQNSIELAKADEKEVLKGKAPRLIDEWQKVPNLWNLIKADLDKDYEFGKYLITGSTTPPNPKIIQHSGAGRITRMLLKPFSLYESKESSGIISLNKMFKKNKDFKTVIENSITLKDIARLMCRGGWPLSVLANRKYALESTKNYYNGLFTVENESDEFAIFLNKININLLILILKSYARNISTQCKKTTMIADIINSGERKKLDENTFDKYAKILENLFIIYDMPAWNTNLRSSTVIRTAPTHHFIDTSIALASLDIRPEDLFNDMKSFGYFFEDFAIRDLSIYAQSFNATIKHYRDSDGQEVDAIIELPNSDYGAIEIKIASDDNINDAIKSLNSFEKKIKKSNKKTPSFKMVLTSHGPCYKKDDIYIVPITCLKN